MKRARQSALQLKNSLIIIEDKFFDNNNIYINIVIMIAIIITIIIVMYNKINKKS